MTLQDLIDELTALPASARTAGVYLHGDIEVLQPESVRYTLGEVTVVCRPAVENEVTILHSLV